MKRLTKPNGSGGYYHPDCMAVCDGNCQKCKVSDEICERLGAYEDTGLSPEEIKQLKEERGRLQQSYDAMHRDLQKITELRKQQEWISVNDRLPKNCEWVLYSAWGCFVSITKFVDGKFTSDGVTHWMPLPEPPKEVGND